MSDEFQGSDRRERILAPGPGVARRVLTAGIPAWALLAAVAVVVVAFSVAMIAQARSSVHLGPAVGVSQSVDVHLVLCNRDVDRLQLNPRKAELGLEKVMRDEGAQAVDVVLERRDCPEPAARPS